jgi:DNA replication and repair protein RecF
MIQSLTLHGLRGYAELAAEFPPGAQLIWGPNAAGKTSLLEAIVLLAWGRSHRTTNDAELVRWGSDLARVAGSLAGGHGRAGTETIEVAIVPSVPGSTGRKRIRVNGVPRRAAALVGLLRMVIFAPEEMLLVAGAPGLRRAAIDQLAAQRWPTYGSIMATYSRALAQRNSLLRAIREEQAQAAELRYWDDPFLEAGSEVVRLRHDLLAELAGPLERAHAEIAPEESAAGTLGLRYVSNAPARDGETARQALARRLVETAEKELWNGTTLVGPHRDDVSFELGGRDLVQFASRGQQRTAILALKLAELDLLTTLDGQPPLLLLDDVFSELDPERRTHLVRRIAELPQAFVTTTTPNDLAPSLVRIATTWEVRPGGALAGGAELLGPQQRGSALPAAAT